MVTMVMYLAITMQIIGMVLLLGVMINMCISLLRASTDHLIDYAIEYIIDDDGYSGYSVYYYSKHRPYKKISLYKENGKLLHFRSKTDAEIHIERICSQEIYKNGKRVKL